MPKHWLIVPAQGKKPLGYQWEQYPLTPECLRDQLARTGKVRVRDRSGSFYEVQPTGIGLLCGQNSLEFLIAVDCDGTSAYDKMRTIAPEPLPPTVAFTSGRHSRAQYLFKIPKLPQKLRSRKINTAPQEALELRGTNLQSVLPPSMHPETGYYCWLPGCSPNEIEVATSPEWVIEQMLEKKQASTLATVPKEPDPKKPKLICHQHYHTQPTGVDVDKALLLLEVIHPKFADDYDSWIKVGMALKSVDPYLLKAWEEWSQLSPKYKPGECEYKWQSFTKWGITIRTLHQLANFSH
ncbi:MAG: bifunctional DNA primase/polymerase [Rhizonema sp. NSF051]|nr:bifunctional DNA primase/polymerase [Rhizonema sp. NSF051]